MVEKSLMITKFSDTISSGKNSLLLSFLRYPFLPGYLSLRTDTHFHIKLYSLSLSLSLSLPFYISLSLSLSLFLSQEYKESEYREGGDGGDGGIRCDGIRNIIDNSSDRLWKKVTVVDKSVMSLKCDCSCCPNWILRDIERRYT